MENAVAQAEKELIVLRKLLCKLKKSQYGKLSDLVKHRIAQTNIKNMLHIYQQADNIILELKNLIDQTANFSTYLQNQLMLETDQNNCEQLEYKRNN